MLNDKHESAYALFGHYSTCRDPSPQNVDFWTEREATRYIGNIRCRYLRLQAEWDHAQPPNAQWPNDGDNPPAYYSGRMQNHPGELQRIVLEMADMPPVPFFGDFDGDGDVDLDDYAGFAGCVTGPQGGPIAAGCEPTDFDADDDVDVADFGTFQEVFTGPL